MNLKAGLITRNLFCISAFCYFPWESDNCISCSNCFDSCYIIIGVLYDFHYMLSSTCRSFLCNFPVSRWLTHTAATNCWSCFILSATPVALSQKTECRIFLRIIHDLVIDSSGISEIHSQFSIICRVHSYRISVVVICVLKTGITVFCISCNCYISCFRSFNCCISCCFSTVGNNQILCSIWEHRLFWTVIWRLLLICYYNRISIIFTDIRSFFLYGNIFSIFSTFQITVCTCNVWLWNWFNNICCFRFAGEIVCIDNASLSHHGCRQHPCHWTLQTWVKLITHSVSPSCLFGFITFRLCGNMPISYIFLQFHLVYRNCSVTSQLRYSFVSQKQIYLAIEFLLLQFLRQFDTVCLEMEERSFINC